MILDEGAISQARARVEQRKREAVERAVRRYLSKKEIAALGLRFEPGWAEFSHEERIYSLSPGFPAFLGGYVDWHLSCIWGGIYHRTVGSSHLYDEILACLNDPT